MPLLLKALIAQDMFLAGTIVLLLGVLTVIGTFISDLLLAGLDPRIRLTSHRTDIAILVILWVQLVIGLSTLPASKLKDGRRCASAIRSPSPAMRRRWAAICRSGLAASA